jgi:hypothetical protein
MHEESPVDLDLLDPGEPSDLVRPAVRRFRWRVVLFTVGSVLLAASLAAWGTKAVIDYQNRFTIEDAMPHGMTALLLDARLDCKTPTYKVGGLQITLLDTASTGGGRIALHFIVHGEALSAQRDQSDGSSFRSSTAIAPTRDPSGVGTVLAMPRARWGEAYVVAPAPRTNPVSMTVTGPSLQSPGHFSVDVASVSCS